MMHKISELEPLSLAGRKISRDHFSFFVGYLEGISLKKLSDTYLYDDYNATKIKHLIRWMQDEFIAASRRYNPKLTKLLRIPPALLNSTVEVTLAEFQKKVDPGGNFYSESDLIEQYTNEYGVDRKAARNSRLRRNIINAVRELEPYLSSNPDVLDPMEFWFESSIADRFASARKPIKNFAALLKLMALRGINWHRAIPKIGPKRAARIEKWMSRHNLIPDSEGVALLAKDIGQSTGIVPLERFILPPQLSGAEGTNRRYGHIFAAKNDSEAIEAWLKSFNDKSVHTIRSYRTQAERFLLWIVMERGVALSSATQEDAVAYRDFLANLIDCEGRDDFLDKEADLYIKAANQEVKWTWGWNTSLDQWVGKNNAARRSREWRPFTGKLSSSSQKLSIVIINSMFEYLVEMKYLESNPFNRVKPASSEPRLLIEHALSESQLDFVIHACDSLPRNEAFFRLKFLLVFAYKTGLRLSELASSQVAKLHAEKGEINIGLKPSDDSDGWEIAVVGKGNVFREVPLTTGVIELLQDYMAARGFGTDPFVWPEGTPLLATLMTEELGAWLHKGKKKWISGMPLKPYQIYRILKTHFQRSAQEIDNPRDAAKLMHASTHWLRHTFATHTLNRGGEEYILQKLLGHASANTTAQYTNPDKKLKRATVNLLTGP
jgi:site-specific recombinase XerD